VSTTEFNGTQIEDHLQRASNFIDIEEYDNAIVEYNLILSMDSMNSLAYSGLGFVYYKRKEYNMAIDFCNKSIEYNNKNERAYRYLGYIYDDMNEYEKAFQFYSKSIESEETAAAYRFRGRYYVRKNDMENAISDYEQVIKLDPEDDNVYAILAGIYYNNKHYSRALKYANNALEINPENVFARNILEIAQKDGISLNEKGAASISITIEVGKTINEYVQSYPYLTAVSAYLLIDRRSEDTGKIFLYLFDENSKKIISAILKDYSPDRRSWFNNILTNLIAEGHIVEQVNELDRRLIIDKAPIEDSDDYKITQYLELDNESASLYYVIEYIE
jgi:tetratricopeptide (TPR) repeat protein